MHTTRPSGLCRLAGLLVAGAMLATPGCMGFKQYRTITDVPYPVPDANPANDSAYRDSRKNSWLQLDAAGRCNLFTIEFDDMGVMWDTDLGKPAEELTQKRGQFTAAWDAITRIRKANQPLNLIIYVHGWHHNASFESGNFREFADFVQGLHKLKETDRFGRPIHTVGVYIGWRGEMTNWPLLKYLSYYSRDATSQRVGGPAMTRVLHTLAGAAKGNVRDLHFDAERIRANSRVIVVGHSMGGQIVEKSLIQAIIGSRIHQGIYMKEDEEARQQLERTNAVLWLRVEACDAGIGHNTAQAAELTAVIDGEFTDAVKLAEDREDAAKTARTEAQATVKLRQGELRDNWFPVGLALLGSKPKDNAATEALKDFEQASRKLTQEDGFVSIAAFPGIATLRDASAFYAHDQDCAKRPDCSWYLQLSNEVARFTNQWNALPPKLTEDASVRKTGTALIEELTALLKAVETLQDAYRQQVSNELEAINADQAVQAAREAKSSKETERANVRSQGDKITVERQQHLDEIRVNTDKIREIVNRRYVKPADLIVLLNPATTSFNALQFRYSEELISDETNQRSSDPWIVAVSSPADTANRKIFKIARYLDSGIRKFRKTPRPPSARHHRSHPIMRSRQDLAAATNFWDGEKTYYVTTPPHHEKLISHQVFATNTVQNAPVTRRSPAEWFARNWTNTASADIEAPGGTWHISPLNTTTTQYWIMHVTDTQLIAGHSVVFDAPCQALLGALARESGILEPQNITFSFETNVLKRFNCNVLYIGNTQVVTPAGLGVHQNLRGTEKEEDADLLRVYKANGELAVPDATYWLKASDETNNVWIASQSGDVANDAEIPPGNTIVLIRRESSKDDEIEWRPPTKE